jgi:two-component system chemotaxis response regulator CheY
MTTPVPMKANREKPVAIAIVEDNPEIADLYALLIQSNGMHVCFVARNGDEAVRAYKNAGNKPDLLLMDHRMPVKSGLEAMIDILTIDPGARFIFISADEGIRDEAMAAGAKAFIRKPASMKEIYDAIRFVLSIP